MSSSSPAREEEVKRELSNTNACHRLEVYFYQMFHVYRVGLVANSGTLLVRVRRFEKSAEDVYSQKIELDKRYTLPLPPAGLALGSVDIRLPLPALCPISKPIYAPECCPATLRNASTIPGSAGGTSTRAETEEERRVGLIPDVPEEGVYAAAPGAAPGVQRALGGLDAKRWGVRLPL